MLYWGCTATLQASAAGVEAEIAVLEHGPALQFSLERLLVSDRQAGVELLTLSRPPPHNTVSKIHIKEIK